MLQLSGLASGLDTQSIIQQLVAVERVPINKLEDEKATISEKKTALGGLENKLLSLQAIVKNLNDEDLYGGRKTSIQGTPDDPAVSALADSGTITGSYKFQVLQLATKSVVNGANNIGTNIHNSTDVSGVTLSSMNLNNPITEGSFTVNGKLIDVQTSDSLQDVFDAISTATGGSVIASYDPGSDTISLSSASEIKLGSSADTSNFLTIAKLFSNGTGAVESNAKIGSVKTGAMIADAGLGVQISAGTFTVNASTVTINEGDSLDTIFSSISAATGGAVTASYDSGTEKITLSSGAAITLGDASDTSNFLSITHLSENATGSVSSKVSLGALDTALPSNNYHITANFNTAFTAGNFTVGGNTVSILATDSLDDIFSKISAATSGDITASYDSTSKKISLISVSKTPITLGDATDTSNFLTVAQLAANKTDSVASLGSLGTLNTADDIQNLTVTGAMFSVNGVNISYNTQEENIADIIEKVNRSAANVTMSYDVITDSFRITNDSEGSLDVALDDQKGTLLKTMGLVRGATTLLGLNAQFKLNDGTALTSTSNKLSSDVHGVTGLTVTALATGTETVIVEPDTKNARAKLDDFISKYNDVQSYIKVNTDISVDDDGKVKTQKLTGNREVDSLSTTLRRSVFSTVSGLSGTVKRLADMGIDFSQDTDELEIKNNSQLDEALSNNSSAVSKLFTDSTQGFAKVFNNLLESYVKTDGSFDIQTDIMDNQVKRINIQISDLERFVAFQEETLQASFLAMEDAQAKMQNQLQFLKF